jgi:hypothetical protein
VAEIDASSWRPDTQSDLRNADANCFQQQRDNDCGYNAGGESRENKNQG